MRGVLLATVIFAQLAAPHSIAAGSADSPAAQPAKNSGPTPEQIKAYLNDFEFGKGSMQALVAMGVKVFPTFEAILADPKAESIHVARIFVVLTESKIERKQFLKHAVSAMTHEDVFVRIKAVNFLGQTGSPESASPAVALLADREKTVVNNAATALVAIGDKWTLAAIDVWLKSRNHTEDKSLRQHVVECREKLKQKLDKAKKPGK